MSLASTIRAAISGKGPKAADNPAPEDEDTKPDATEPEDKKPDAEGDKPDDQAEGDEDKKPDASEDDPEEDAEDRPEEEKAAASAERLRIGAITGHAAAERLPNLAAHLAFNTGLSGKASGRILDAAALDAGSAKPSLHERMNGKVPPLGGGSDKKTDDSLAARAALRFGTQKALKAQKGNAK